jgi:hypothetical protein
MALSPQDHDLAVLAAAVPRDDFALDRLMMLAKHGIGTAITVLAGGKVIHGVIATPDEYAAHLDEIMDKGLGEAATLQPGMSDSQKALAEGAREGLNASPSAEAFERWREAEERYEEELEAAIADLPDDWDYRDLDDELARKFIAHGTHTRFLTLKNATVVTTVPMYPVEVAFVRVSVANIAAWWHRADVADS